MKTSLRRWLFAILLAAMTQSLRASEWQVINVEGRDYLTLENIADFYQLKCDAGTDPQHFRLSDGRVSVETLSNPRELSVNGVKQWLAFPVLYRDGLALVSRFDLSKTIEPCLRPTMIGNLEPFQTVVLDAGHGGQDGGGHTLTGSEKDYTLDVTRDIQKSLESKGLRVVLTRGDDSYLSLEQRAELANSIPDSLFVSVHFNSGEAEATGLEIYAMTPQGAASTSDHHAAVDQLQNMPGNDFDNASLALANCVHHAVLGRLDEPDRGVKRARFAVLRLIHAPAILVEGGFMTSGVDSRRITDPLWRQSLAEAIVTGIRSYQDIVQLKQPPKLVAEYRSEQRVTADLAMTASRSAFRPASPMRGFLRVSNPRPALRVLPRSELITVPARKR